MARASLLAPLILVVPLLLAAGVLALSDLPPSSDATQFLWITSLVVFVAHLVVAGAYLAVTLVLRSLGGLKLWILLALGTAIALGAGLQLQSMEVEFASSQQNPLTAFGLGFVVNLAILSCLTAFWWRIAFARAGHIETANDREA